MADTKLLPCPFCGVAAFRRGLDFGCENTKCTIQPAFHALSLDMLTDCIAAWNTRAPVLTPKQEAADEMFEALKHIAFEPLSDDMEADATTCLAETVKIAIAALTKAGQP